MNDKANKKAKGKQKITWDGIPKIEITYSLRYIVV